MLLFFLLLCTLGGASAARSVVKTTPGTFAGKVVPTRKAQPGQGSAEPDGNGSGVLALATDVTVTALRVGTCALMIHHGFDKLEHVDGFTANVVAKFFGFLPGPPEFWTYSAAATQIAGAGLLGVGLLSRPTAAAMSGTMIAAVAFHLLNTGPEGFPLAVPTAHSYNFELAFHLLNTGPEGFP